MTEARARVTLPRMYGGGHRWSSSRSVTGRIRIWPKRRFRRPLRAARRWRRKRRFGQIRIRPVTDRLEDHRCPPPYIRGRVTLARASVIGQSTIYADRKEKQKAAYGKRRP